MAFKGEANPNGGCNGLFDSLDERPPVHFFRIILPCILDEKKLRIPNMFVRRYGEELSGAAKVIAPSGHAWHIGLTKDQSNIWFDEGWQKFVDHHSIRYGYLLLFAYRGCCNFSVLIFDMSACEIPYPRVGSTSAKNANYDLNVFGSEGKSSKRQNASAEQNLGMKRHRGCNSVQKSQDLKQFGDKRSEEFVKEVDAEIIDLEENGRESGKEKLNYRRMYRTCRSVFNESNNRKDKNKSPSKGEDVGIVAGIPARAFTERTRVICPVKKLEPESPFKVTLDLKQFGDKRSEEFVKEVDAETSDLEENGRESGKEKLNYRRMYRTCRSVFNESNNRKDKNKSPSKGEDVGIVAGIPARAFTERSRVIRPVKKLEPESPFKVTLDLKQFSDKRSKEFVKEVDAEIIDLEENGRESGKEKLNYRRMYRTRRSSLNESNNEDKNKSPSKGEDVGIVAGIPARAFTERSRVIRPVKKLEPESSFKVTLDLKQFGDKRSEEFVKEVDAEIIDLEENGRESGKEKLNHRHMYRTRRSSLNESNNEDKNKSASKSEDVRIVAGIPARAFTESRRVIRPVKKLEPESPSFKVTLQSYNIHKHLLYVPHGFARRHLLGGPAIIKLEVSNGRYWPVQILQHEHQLVTLTKGWSQFVGENDLVEGDVCTFEVLVKGNGSVLKVTVSRDGSRPLKS